MLPLGGTVPTLMTHNCRLDKDIELKFSQLWASTCIVDEEDFRLLCFFITKLWSSQVHRIEWVWKTPFHKSGHLCVGEALCVNLAIGLVVIQFEQY